MRGLMIADDNDAPRAGRSNRKVLLANFAANGLGYSCRATSFIE